MRRLIIALIAAALVLASVSALATGTDTPHDFGDFNLTYPESMTLEQDEKTENGLYFTLYDPANSEEGFANNLNCVWSSNYIDLASFEPQDLLTYTIENVAEQAEEMGLIMTNITPIKADRANLGDREAVLIAYFYDADYSNLGMDKQASLICVTVGVSDPDIGNYNFSITASNQAGIDELSAILDTLTWNK